MSIWLSAHKEVLLQNNIFSHNNSLTPADMRQHYLWGLPFLVSKIYYFEVRCSFVAIKILLCRSREMMQGCRLAGLLGKSIMDFYAINQYFLINAQPNRFLFYMHRFCRICFYIIKSYRRVVKIIGCRRQNTEKECLAPFLVRSEMVKCT